MFGWSIRARAWRLGLEPRQHLLRVHAGLDELHRDEPLDRLGLLRPPHGAHAALADDLDERIPPGDHRAGVCVPAGADRRTRGGRGVRGERAGLAREERVGVGERQFDGPVGRAGGADERGSDRQQSFHLGPQLGVPAALGVQVGGTLGRRFLQCGEADRFEDVRIYHGSLT
ncbi:MAG: hypothetical protein U0835_19050 [Isosphaeraceae bacterium]